jgi:Ca2+/Na+ antiporter
VLGGLLSFAWILAFAYLAIWWCHVISLSFDSHDSLLGMIFLAPGTTFPDLYNIVQATLQGKSEIALSTSVSSNILNIAIGLGVPLFISTLAWGNFKVDSGALFVTSCVQIGMVFVAFLFIGGFKWQLNRSLGKVMFAFYVVYVVIYLVVELTLYAK